MSQENSLRQRHGADSLEWSTDLYQKALEVTDHLALNSIPAQNLRQYERPGLMLAYVDPQTANSDDVTASCRHAIDGWYSQKDNYNFDHPILTDESRDFVQLVWKSSKLVGVSRSRLPNGGSYVASVFQPIGDSHQTTSDGLKKDSINTRFGDDRVQTVINKIFADRALQK